MEPSDFSSQTFRLQLAQTFHDAAAGQLGYMPNQRGAKQAVCQRLQISPAHYSQVLGGRCTLDLIASWVMRWPPVRGKVLKLDIRPGSISIQSAQVDLRNYLMP